MKNKKRTPSWDRLSQEERRVCVDRIVRQFSEVGETPMGIIAAEEMLDFFLETLSDTLYNKGIDTAQKTVGQRFQDLEVDLEMLRV